MQYVRFHLFEAPRAGQNISVADFCFVASQNENRRIYLLNCNVFGTLTDLGILPNHIQLVSLLTKVILVGNHNCLTYSKIDTQSSFSE